MNVGFLGLGIMGSRMAANLIRAGHRLTVWNRSADKADPLVESGAVRANSPLDAARDQDVVITMLANPQAVQAAALGVDGFLAVMQPGALWIDSSTVNPSFSREIAAQASRLSIHFMDAPVAGSRGPAEKGELLFMVGGDPVDLEFARPLLEKMGRSIIYVGPVGMGTSLKMVFNLILAQAMLGFAEGLLLGEALGIERERLFDILTGSSVTAPVVTGKRAKIEADQYEADFPLQWLQKDLELAARSAYEQGLSLPGNDLAKAIFMLAARQGYAESDYSAIYQYLKQEKAPDGRDAE